MKYEILISAIATALAVALARRYLRREFLVQEGFAGLLYRHGKFAELLAAGRHIRWGRGLALTLHDVRQATIPIVGQEVLTADNVGFRASLLVSYQIADPAKAAHGTQQWYAELYNAAQLALRTVAGRMPVEILLSERAALAPQLLAIVQPEAAKIGLTVRAVEIKDVMLPAELKRAFAEVLKAKQEGQAALERARGESAALRNLANAARVLEGNPALMNLRLLQSLAAAQNAGNTLVLGLPGGFVPLSKGEPASAGDAGNAGDAEP